MLCASKQRLHLGDEWSQEIFYGDNRTGTGCWCCGPNCCCRCRCSGLRCCCFRLLLAAVAAASSLVLRCSTISASPLPLRPAQAFPARCTASVPSAAGMAGCWDSRTVLGAMSAVRGSKELRTCRFEADDGLPLTLPLRSRVCSLSHLS